jgi:hypothetical protein
METRKSNLLTQGSSGHGSSPPEEIQDLINQVTESEVLRAAPSMRRLLLYLWQNHGRTISEYAIATEGLGRQVDFDPRLDASVRVQIARLRTKLAEFYEREGKGFPLNLWIPVGGHELQWSYSPGEHSPRPSRSSLPIRYRNALLGVSGAAIVLAVFCLVLLSQNRALKASLPGSPAPLSSLWKSFLVNGKPTAIVVPFTMHFRWADQGVLIVDSKADSFADWKTSPLLRSLAEKWGPPTLNQTFVFARHIFASFRLRDYLEKSGQPVQLIEEPQYSGDYNSTHNTILLGSPGSSRSYIRELTSKMNFDVVKNIPTVIINRKPATGEPSRYEEVELSTKRRICPGIVALLPDRPEGTRTLMLAGRWTPAMVQALTTIDGLKLLDQQLRSSGSPNSWEMVVQAEIESDTTVVRVWPVSCHALPTTFWK